MITDRTQDTETERNGFHLVRNILVFGMIMLIVAAGVWAMDVLGESTHVKHASPEYILAMTLWVR